MKSSRQQKRKIIEVTRKQDEYWGVSVKKSANGTGREHHEATENMGMSQLWPQTLLQIPSGKIKLQLFPVNENTRLGLQKDGYNPFLELTLSARKKMSSVVRHLTTKWSSSTVAIGQVMLFPYNIKTEKLDSCRRWTLNDGAITAGEVYVAVESPSLFRLRYGWYSNTQLGMLEIPPISSGFEAHIDSKGKISGCTRVLEITNHEDEKISEAGGDIQKSINVNEASDSVTKEMKALDVPADHVDDEVTTDVPVQPTVLWDDKFTNLSIGGLLSEISLQGKINGSDHNSVNESGTQPIGLLSDISVGGLLAEASLQGKISNPYTKLENESTLQPILLASSDISIGGLLCEASLLSNKSKLDTQTMERRQAQFRSPWDDCLTTLSMGGLLSEVSLQGKAACNPESKESESSLQPNAPFSDSFDAFATAQLCARSQVLKPTCHKSTLSILDAEETCHAFPIQKFQPSSNCAVASNVRVNSGGCNNDKSIKPFWFPNIAKMNNETVFPKDYSCQELKMNPLPHSRSVFDEDSSLGMSGIDQNESFGPFGLALSSQQVTAGAGGDSISMSEYVR